MLGIAAKISIVNGSRINSDELRSSHVGRWGELNTELHALLYHHASRPKMAATAGQLLKSTDRFTRMQLFYIDGRVRAEEDHEEIVKHCATGNYKLASRTLHHHILNSSKTLVELLRAHKHITQREAS